MLLGSASEGREFRDLDLAFYLNEPEADYLGLVLEWGHRLEMAVGVPVDLVPLEKASIGFQHQATKGQVLHCTDPQLLADWKEQTWNRYFALQPYFRQHARDLLAG